MLNAQDEHSLPRERVNGPLTNSPDFHRAFGCKLRVSGHHHQLLHGNRAGTHDNVSKKNLKTILTHRMG